MNTKVKREYVITLTKEEAVILSDTLETIPSKKISKTAKVSQLSQKKTNFLNDLYDNIVCMLEIDFEDNELKMEDS